MPDVPRPSPVTAHSLERYPEALPPPASAQGPDLLADHTALAGLYHRLRSDYQTLVEWALAGPSGGGAE